MSQNSPKRPVGGPRVQRSYESRNLSGVRAGRAPRTNPATEKSPAGRVQRSRNLQSRGGALTRQDERALAKQLRDEKWNENIERIRVGHDWVFFILVVVLLSIGTIMVYSASYPSAINDGLGGFYYVRRQLIWIGVGGVAMLMAAFVPSSWIRKGALVFYSFTAVMLLLVLFMGDEGGGAQRWLEIPGLTFFRIQPSEIGKLALTIALAWYLSKYEEYYKNTSDKKQKFIYGILCPSLFIFCYAGLVLLEKHLSGTVIIVTIGVIIMFLAGSDWKMMLPYFLIIGSIAITLYLITHPYALERITTFTDKEADVLDEKWQTNQGTLAIGSGGFLGLGLGQSRQKYGYVSEAQNDFIFTIWCEEMGFVGALLIVALFLALVYRGYRIALRAPDTFSSLMVFGIVTQVGLQAFLNIMVVTDIIPNTGISLPFLSYGGSSLVMMMAQMGIVLSVSRRSYQKLK